MVSNVSKVITFLETFKALRLASEQGASHDKFGYLVPAASPLIASSILFPKFYPEMVEMIQLLGSSGLIMIPSELDFRSESGPYLNQYLKGQRRMLGIASHCSGLHGSLAQARSVVAKPSLNDSSSEMRRRSPIGCITILNSMSDFGAGSAIFFPERNLLHSLTGDDPTIKRCEL